MCDCCRKASVYDQWLEYTPEEMDRLYANNILLCERSVEPTEILWQNLFGKRGLFVVRRAVIYFIGFIVIFFLTTPTVILSNIDFLKVFQ